MITIPGVQTKDFCYGSCKEGRMGPISYKWSAFFYPYKWPYKWVTEVIIPPCMSRVMTLL